MEEETGNPNPKPQATEPFRNASNHDGPRQPHVYSTTYLLHYSPLKPLSNCLLSLRPTDTTTTTLLVPRTVLQKSKGNHATGQQGNMA